MNRLRHLFFAIVAASTACAMQDVDPAGSGTTSASHVGADLLSDLQGVEKKLVDLAGAIPEDKYDWRPAEGVRTVREVFLHLASDNYLLPAMMGFTPDPSTGIAGGDYNTAVAFEKRLIGKDSVVAEVARSFTFVRESLDGMTVSRMAEPVTMFGQPFTGQSAWLLTVTHLHEHLGQLIAYARTNGIVPPWS